MIGHAQVLFAGGDPAGAETCARHAIELRPDHAATYGILAKSLAQQGKLGEAWAAAVDSVVRDPDEFDDFTAVAGFIIEPLGLDTALELADRSVRANPELAVLRVWLAALCVQGEDYDRARAEFDTVLAGDPAQAVCGLAVQCLDLCERPAELADLHTAFSAAG